ncbi:hypothetical protein HNP46_003976 [Pseudomonas nitritireducens]|uniref:Spore protein YkvP/CgeB glycosyl transferase-like domain-containing protein n=1 Tax=Pseudomonas nitroreducens TaxID=46680 RepID=A0A7W7P328_PSENT|nr:glycosyltransferase [Pseudomonas nitritireducens]MBB4865100.1 hypothetical protein [Pseudomonas nitritireducens]
MKTWGRRWARKVAQQLGIYESLVLKKKLAVRRTLQSSEPLPVVEIVKSTRVTLSSAPQWNEASVKPGDTVSIRVAVTYENTSEVSKKALLLIKLTDLDGNEVAEASGRLARSEKLKSSYKYLASTLGKVVTVYEFKVPEGGVGLQVGFCAFNTQPGEAVHIDQVEILSRKKAKDVVQFVAPSAEVAAISILGWPEYPENDKPYVIGVMDEFTTGCFEQEVNLIQPRPDNWYALAEKYKPAMFFIESAWKGNQGSWQYRVGEYSNKPGQEIAFMSQYARDKGIPMVFWNKEDPVHHDKFMCSAKLADHIFTTDENMRGSYRRRTGNSNVHALPFAAQPKLHQPAPLEGRLARSCFAGSWYGDRHANRGRAMRWLLQAANRHGLDIYDRNHGTGLFPFPEEYQAGIKGSLPYKRLCAEYSRYRVFLNVNSVTDSPTMFSRRVFELMACGTPVVSTYAKGIEDLFESDAVWMVSSEQEAEEAIHTLLTDDREWRRRSLLGIREVFSRHTYAHRINSVFGHVGLPPVTTIDPNILLIARVSSEAELYSVTKLCEQQVYQNYTIAIECHGAADLFDLPVPAEVVLVQPGYFASAEFESRAVTYDASGWLSPHAGYGRHYLRDLANAMRYQPQASGWAKALVKDAFQFGQNAQMDGALWQMQEFLQHGRFAAPEGAISSPRLYCADSKEYFRASFTQSVAGL